MLSCRWHAHALYHATDTPHSHTHIAGSKMGCESIFLLIIQIIAVCIDVCGVAATIWILTGGAVWNLYVIAAPAAPHTLTRARALTDGFSASM